MLSGVGSKHGAKNFLHQLFFCGEDSPFSLWPLLMAVMIPELALKNADTPAAIMAFGTRGLRCVTSLVNISNINPNVASVDAMLKRLSMMEKDVLMGCAL